MTQTSNSSGQRFLVTGACGCIGAWTVRQLVSEGAYVVALDISSDIHRLRLLLTDDELGALPYVQGDITDLDELQATLDKHEVTNVIHLAALQVPFCRADPPLGARVNVVGTVNVFEALARSGRRTAPVVYASSIAAYEEVEAGVERAASADGGVPGTLYGVYKRANEGVAALYWRDHGIPSIGLRPHTVYGPARDQGVTSAPTVAMLAAAADLPFHIPYGGRHQLQYAPDVARVFIAASRAPGTGVSVHNLAGHVVSMGEIVAAIERAAPASTGRITFEPALLPFPEEVDARSLSEAIGEIVDTPVDTAVAETIDRFRRLLADGLVVPPDGQVTSAVS